MVTIENRCRFPVFLLSGKNETRIEPGSSLSLALPEGNTYFSLRHKKSSYDRLHSFHIFADVNVSLSSAAEAETVTVTEFHQYNGAYNEVHALRLTGCVGKCDCVYFVPDAALLKKKICEKAESKDRFRRYFRIVDCGRLRRGVLVRIKIFLPRAQNRGFSGTRRAVVDRFALYRFSAQTPFQKDVP